MPKQSARKTGRDNRTGNHGFELSEKNFLGINYMVLQGKIIGVQGRAFHKSGSAVWAGNSIQRTYENIDFGKEDYIRMTLKHQRLSK